MAAGGQTAVTLRLREPATVWDGWTKRGPVRVLHVVADDPVAFEAAMGTTGADDHLSAESGS